MTYQTNKLNTTFAVPFFTKTGENQGDRYDVALCSTMFDLMMMMKSERDKTGKETMVKSSLLSMSVKGERRSRDFSERGY
jgi:hypothetical protein